MPQPISSVNPGSQPPQVPAEHRLHAQEPLPRGVLQAHEPLRVVFADRRAGRLVHHGCRNDIARNASRPASACATLRRTSQPEATTLWDVNYDDACISYRAAEILRFRVAAPSMSSPATLGDVKRYWSTHVNDIEDDPDSRSDGRSSSTSWCATATRRCPTCTNRRGADLPAGASRLLKNGCGPGVDLVHLAATGASVTAVDLHEAGSGGAAEQRHLRGARDFDADPSRGRRRRRTAGALSTTGRSTSSKNGVLRRAGDIAARHRRGPAPCGGVR